MPDFEDVTELLSQLSAGNRDAEALLMNRVYPDLRRIARRYMCDERNNHTLQATALINEAYLRLVDQRTAKWENRAHFFAVAAQIMRRILVDYARAHRSGKRGGGYNKIDIDEIPLVSSEDLDNVLLVDEALSRLAQWDSRQSRVVELRFFGGLGEHEIAEILGVTTRTVNRDWGMAKAWLYGQLNH